MKNHRIIPILFLFFFNYSFSQTNEFKIIFGIENCVKCSYELITNDTIIEGKKTNEEGLLFIEDTILKKAKDLRIYLENKIVNIPDFKEKKTSIFDCKEYIKKKFTPNELEEVIIYVKKNIIEDEGDKLVYNVEKDGIKTAINSTDVLRKTPFVSVDVSGNPSIKGNSNVLILLNGKEVNGLQTSQILNQIPANEIIKIEVITSPGAKYEAEGTAGILNIITKKKNSLISSGNLGLGLGTSGSHFFLNHNYQIDKRYTLSNAVGSLLYYPSYENNQNLTADKVIVFTKYARGENMGQMYYYQIALTDEDKKRPLDFSLSYYYSNEKNTENFKTLFNPIELASKTINNYQYFKLKTDYKMIFSEKNKINYSIALAYLPLKNSYLNDSVKNENSSSVITPNLQIDYDFIPIKKWVFNVGAKINFNFYKGDNSGYFNNNLTTQHFFTAKQSLFGSYIDSKYKLNNRINFSLGLRYEDFRFYYLDLVDKSFQDLFYNLGFTYKFTTKNVFSINFNRRTQRPSYYNLIPVESASSSNVSSNGNPSLKSGIAYNFELGFSKYLGDNFIKVSPFYKRINDKISNLIVNSNNNFSTSFINLDKEENFGISLWLTANLFKQKLTFNYGLDMIYKKLYFNEISNNGIQFLNNLNVTYGINSHWRFNFFGSFNTPNIYIQGKENSYTYNNFSLQKDFINHNLTLALSIDNPFSKGFIYRQYYTIENKNFSNEQLYLTRGFRIFVIFKFGNPNKQTKIKENEDQDILKKEIN